MKFIPYSHLKGTWHEQRCYSEQYPKQNLGNILWSLILRFHKCFWTGQAHPKQKSPQLLVNLLLSKKKQLLHLWPCIAQVARHYKKVNLAVTVKEQLTTRSRVKDHFATHVVRIPWKGELCKPKITTIVCELVSARVFQVCKRPIINACYLYIVTKIQIF